MSGRDVADRGPSDREQGARAAARQAAPLGVGDLLPAHACAYHFFRVISLRTSSSRSRSAHHLLQPPVFLLQLPQALDVRGLQRAEVLPPAVDRLGADAVLLGHLRHRPLVGLAEDRHHLLFGESCLLHGSLSGPRAPFSQASAGPKIAGQVSWVDVVKVGDLTCDHQSYSQAVVDWQIG